MAKSKNTQVLLTNLKNNGAACHGMFFFSESACLLLDLIQATNPPVGVNFDRSKLIYFLRTKDAGRIGTFASGHRDRIAGFDRWGRR